MPIQVRHAQRLRDFTNALTFLRAVWTKEKQDSSRRARAHLAHQFSMVRSTMRRAKSVSARFKATSSDSAPSPDDT